MGADLRSDNACIEAFAEKLDESDLRRAEVLLHRLRTSALAVVKVQCGEVKLIRNHRLRQSSKLQKNGTCHDAAATEAVRASQHNSAMRTLGHKSNNVSNKPARTKSDLRLHTNGVVQTHMHMEARDGG